jgi:hypothetical protein
MMEVEDPVPDAVDASVERMLKEARFQGLTLRPSSSK